MLFCFFIQISLCCADLNLNIRCQSCTISNQKCNLKIKGFINLNAHDTHWSNCSLHWRSQVTQQNLVSCFTEWVGRAELVCSSTAVNGSYRHASTFFRSKSLTVSDNILELWIIPSSFWENDKVHLWGEKTREMKESSELVLIATAKMEFFTFRGFVERVTRKLNTVKNW